MHSWAGAVYGGLCLCRGSTAAEAKNAQAADAQRLPIGQCPAGQANVTRPDTLREREIGIAALMGYLLQQLPGGAVRAGFQRITLICGSFSIYRAPPL